MRCLSLALLLTSSTALAGDGSATVVSFHGATDLFRGSQLSDFIPADSSLSIRFAADMDSHLEVDMSGESQLTWPGGELHQSWQDIKGAGVLTLTTQVALSADVAVDLWGLNFTYNMWNQSFTWIGEQPFNTLLLPGNPENSVTVNVHRVEYGVLAASYQVNSFMVLQMTGDIAPDNTATVVGQKIRTNRRDVADISQFATLDPPELNNGTMDLESQWYGSVNASFAMDISPTISLCGTFTSCFSVPINYHWTIADDARTLKSNTESYSLAIPAVTADASELRFGEVDIGRSSSMTINVGSRSQAPLSGQLISDHPAITVEPASFNLATGQSHPATITFAPQTEGEMRGSVIIQTDDPTQPELVIDVFGSGHRVPDGPDDPGTEPVVDTSDTALPPEPESGCGCQSGGAPVGSAAGLLALGLLLLRRREG